MITFTIKRMTIGIDTDDPINPFHVVRTPLLFVEKDGKPLRDHRVRVLKDSKIVQEGTTGEHGQLVLKTYYKQDEIEVAVV